MNPSVLLIDVGCIAYIIEGYLQRYPDDPNTVRSGVIRWIDERLFLNSAEPVAPIWLLDSPPYWRSRYEPEYKAHRPPSDLSPSKTIKAIKAEGTSVLSIKGLEADDLAGAIVRSLPGTKVYLLTSDNDWAGLINDNVSMLSPIHSPHIRERIHAWAWLNKHYQALPKCRQLLYKMPDALDFNPASIWGYKARLGDPGDNLPTCSHLGLVSLLRPIYDPLQDEQTNEAIWRCLLPALDNAIPFDYGQSQAYALALPELPFTPIRIGKETIE